MTIGSLLLRELLYRKVNFLFSVLAVALGISSIVAAVLALRIHDRDTEWVLARKAEASQAAWAHYKDEVRKDMLKMGFNLMILHRDQHLSNPAEETRYIPEAYAEKLARSQLALMNHILPFLQQKAWWPEQKRWITLVGTGGEVYIKNPSKQTPLVERVEYGKAILGYAIHQSLKLRDGDPLVFGGRTFEIQACLPGRSPEEDEQIWVPLGDAQELLDKKGLITGMLAVDCNCSPTDLLQLKDRITALLPDTRIVEYNTRLLTRALVRAKAARQADEAVERERVARGELKEKRITLAAWLVPATALLSMIWLGVLTWLNVGSRRVEIGILGALGLSRGRILLLFVGKAVISGFGAGLLGGALGLAVLIGQDSPGQLVGPSDLGWLLGCVGGAVVMSVLASWVPSLVAAGMDPAMALQEE